MPIVQIIQNSPRETPGILSYVLEDEGIPFVIYPVDAWPTLPPELDGAGGLIILGGPMGVHDQGRHPFLTWEIHRIEKALAMGVPILGIGLGSQLLAAALGARAVRGRHREIGWIPVTLTAAAAQDPLWAGIASPFLAFHWHNDVFEIPMGATRLAYSAWTYGQAFRFGHNAYGFQFHLEATYPIVTGLADAFASELADAGVDGQVMTDEASMYIPRLHRIGRTVLSRWTDFVFRGTGRRTVPSGTEIVSRLDSS
jgi:GMP synthase (glutamine-hydrolysing)